MRVVNASTVSSVIFETRQGTLQRILDDEIFPLLSQSRERILSRETPIQSQFPLFRKLKRFNMVATVLPRDNIFELAESRNVIKVYPNNLLKALVTIPVVGQDALFTIPAKGRKKEKTVTSTFHTRKLMGVENIPFQGRGVKVGVLDTGNARIHEQNNDVTFETVTPQRRDENGHGTWCVTCIAGGVGFSEALGRATGKEVQALGVAPLSKILSVKCLGWFIGTGSTAGIIEAIEKAVEFNSKILSMSLGGPNTFNVPEDDPMFPVFQKVVAAGTIPVIAAGNEGPDDNTIGTPGSFEDVLTVGAYDPINGDMADFSSRGPTNWGSIKPDVTAPGVNIVSGSAGIIDHGDGKSDRYAPLSGTSMATPHVSGLLSAMEEGHRAVLGKELSMSEIKKMMMQLGDPKTNLSGWGPIDWQMYQQWMSTEHGVTV